MRGGRGGVVGAAERISVFDVIERGGAMPLSDRDERTFPALKSPTVKHNSINRAALPRKIVQFANLCLV
jgi:hypothetical protein